jgi:hypothetical protein
MAIAVRLRRFDSGFWASFKKLEVPMACLASFLRTDGYPLMSSIRRAGRVQPVHRFMVMPMHSFPDVCTG